MNWLHYLVEANLYLAVFYIAYCLLLSRSTYYQLSRAYLILSCVVSFILPVLQISALRPVRQSVQLADPRLHIKTVEFTVDAAPEMVVHPPGPAARTAIAKATPAQTQAAATVVKRRLTLPQAIWYAYLAGSGILTVMLLIKLLALIRLTGKGRSVKEGKHRVIYLPGTDVAFSFFNYMFIGTEALGGNTVITHELVHIRQKHSADIIFLELLKVVNWFNPVVYLQQNSLKTVHEYIADELTAAAEADVLTYSSFLLNNAYGAQGPSIAHSFFTYNLLKKRIIMLNQQRSGKLARLKYLVAIPICAVLLCASTLVFSKTYAWVDLAPAKANVAVRHASANHAARHKRLKVTQNGVSVVADQFAFTTKDERMVFSAGNITRADRSFLLQNHDIKVEVVEDSTLLTTKDGHPMLPVINVDGYYQLDHFLHNSIKFTAAKGDKGGLVEIGFGLDASQHIVNAHVVKSGGDKLDALALNGFNAYKGTVNDAGGRNYKIGVYFFTDDYSIFKTDSLGNDPEFAGELIITTYKYPVRTTSKGYEIEESNGGGFDANNARVLIYEKNGQVTWFYRNKCSEADLKLLKDKYGYIFPTSTTNIIQFMHPANVPGKYKVAYAYDINSYLDAPYAGDFFTQMADNVQYPLSAQKAQTGGVVLLNFDLSTDGLIKNVAVAQSAGSEFDQSAVNALLSYKTVINDKPGKHSIAMVFCVADKKYRPAVSDAIKNKEGYVGELAVAEYKSVIKMMKK